MAKVYKPTTFINGRNRTVDITDKGEQKTRPLKKGDSVAQYGEIDSIGTKQNCFSQNDWYTPTPLFGAGMEAGGRAKHETRAVEKHYFNSKKQVDDYIEAYQRAINGKK